MTDILIIGGGVAANLAAAYFHKTMPELEVVIVDRSHRNRPIVGESLIDVSTGFLRSIGLGMYLVEKHYPKYGLTYYFKLNLNDPTDRTYFVDESPVIPPHPSFQINRFVFDRDLRLLNAANGVRFEEGWVVATDTDGAPLHTVVVEDQHKQRRTISSRWLVDASGRNRVLGRRLGLQTKPQLQKDVFWFRLVDFDPSILAQINTIKKVNRVFESYYCTHHFFGKGNWIWCIPIRSEEHRNMISIGITYRKDVYPYQVTTIQDFIEYVRREHPVVAELVQSGHVADVNYYRSYMYESKQHYSPDRWFVIGDAGDTVDPLYSLGLSLIAVQIRQVAAIIGRDCEGLAIDDFTHELDTAYLNVHRLATRDITDLYEWMHDPYCCHLLMHLMLMTTFYVGVPLTMNGYLWDPIGVRVINKFASQTAIEADLKPLKELIIRAALRPINRSPQHFTKVQSTFGLNYPFFENPREEEIPKSAWQMYFYLVRFRLKLLRTAGWRTLTSWEQ
ncbi:MAG: tryptophan 7-halogenase, partial [Chloroflexi bacterium]|nr:tryptophan 7-halogenase [Chloroflexota bacterium]